MAFLRFVFLSAVFLWLPIATAAQQSVPARITQSIDESNLTVLKGNTHPLARAEFDRGPAPPSLPLSRMLLVLKRSPQQEVALEALLDEQQDKSSPNYHSWLTPEQFGQQFGPAEEDIQIVTSWLVSHGFQVNRVSKGGILIEFSGTAGQLPAAFHTEIHKYVVNGEDHWANATDPQIPTALTPVVAGIRSLHNFFPKPFNQFAGAFHKDKETGKVTPIGPTAVPQFVYGSGCGIIGGPCEFLGPYDLATIYNVLPLWNAATPIDGTGQTIAIVGETDINPTDWTNFWNFFGVSTPKGTLNIIHDGPDPGILQDGEEAEADIDTQWSSAVAKGATIDFVVSEATETTTGIDLSAEYIIDNNLASVMSESYGACELFLGTAGNAYFNALWQQASAQGISVLLASGDQGSAVCDAGAPAARYGLTVSGYASTPYNVAVGGTDFNDLTTTSSYWSSSNSTSLSNAIGHIPEMTWNDTCTNSEIFTYLDTTTGEQTCNNSTAQKDGFLSVTGGSGGASNCTSSDGQTASSCTGGYSKPSWQTGAGVPNDGKRDVPDVSLFASNGFNGSGYVVCELDAPGGQGTCNPAGGSFLGFGGTSVSSPAFAGIVALVDQKMGGRQGNPNYVLYQMAGGTGNSCDSSTVPVTGTNSCIFYDIPSGSTNAMPCVTGSTSTCVTSTAGDTYGVLNGYSTTTGYDRATGLGTVNVANLVNNWSTYAGQFKGSTFSAFTLGPPTTVTHGQPIAIAAAVVSQSGTGPTPTGAVTLITNTGSSPSGEQVAGQVFPLTNGSISSGTTTIELPGGTNYTVTAHYSGDSTYAPSDSSPVSVTVNPEPSKTFANLETFDVNGNLISFSASGATYGSGYYLFRVDVGDAAASFSTSAGISSNCSKGLTSCPTGSISFTGAPLAGDTLPLNVRGFAENQSLTTGAYAVTANYPGDSSYGPSSATASFTIAKAPTTLSGSIAGAAVQYGQSEEISAGLNTTSNGAEPTGTFSFSVDGSPLTTSAMNYEGFPYQPNTSPPTYAYLDATALAAFLSLGSHTLTVQYSGDANYAASTSPSFTFTVAKGQPVISSYGANPASINLGQETSLFAQLSYGSGATPTGTMTFYDNNAAITGTPTYISQPESLMASMPYTPTAAGRHNITVTYSGDANYLSATTQLAAALIVVGPGFTMSPQPGSAMVTAGNSATYTVAIAATDGFTGNVSVTCSLSAAATTCAANPTTVAAGASTTITVTTTAHQLVRPMPFTYRVGPRLQIVPFVVVLLFILWAFGLSTGRTKRRVRVPLSLVVVLLCVLFIESCGGGGSTQPPPPHGTQPGTYAVTITGTSGSITNTATVALTVQ
jgi:Pro-kumamolisin, activation domain/Bacterial Ig-like domain (group 3)